MPVPYRIHSTAEPPQNIVPLLSAETRADIGVEPVSYTDLRAHETTLSMFRETYESLIVKVRELGCIPVMLSLPPIDSIKFYSYICSGFCTEKRNNVLRWLGGTVNTIGNWHEMYNLELYRIAAAEGVRLIDITTCFLSRRDFTELFCDDGMHPNEAGHHIISDAICASFV